VSQFIKDNHGCEASYSVQDNHNLEASHACEDNQNWEANQNKESEFISGLLIWFLNLFKLFLYVNTIIYLI